MAGRAREAAAGRRWRSDGRSAAARRRSSHAREAVASLRRRGRCGPAPARLPSVGAQLAVTARPHSDVELTAPLRHGLLRNVTDTDVRLWRRVHMDLVRYAGCMCRPSC
ncbi:putative leader peptide [Streptomyces himalayensis]|uniref:putative leader peptide n=1 Tax=Streptomyces himalayensis TaxID=2820085 RepID=UPI0028A8F00C|nr:putative leader peptide [Streptomyces himalayensis]